MTKEQITSLLDKYWEAETSVEEEKVLKAYFSSDEIEPTVRQYKTMFAHFEKQADV